MYYNSVLYIQCRSGTGFLTNLLAHVRYITYDTLQLLDVIRTSEYPVKIDGFIYTILILVNYTIKIYYQIFSVRFSVEQMLCPDTFLGIYGVMYRNRHFFLCFDCKAPKGGKCLIEIYPKTSSIN